MRRIHAGLVLLLLGSAAVAGAQAPRGGPAGDAAPAAAAFRELPPLPADTADPADSLYRAGREALNRGRWQEASDAFRRIYDRYPESRYAADAMYWHAFALYRLGGLTNLRVALARLDRQADEYPNAATRGDARALATRIRGELAKRGDAEAAAAIAQAASAAAVAPPAATVGPTPATPPAPRAAPSPRAAPTPRTPPAPRAPAPGAVPYMDRCEDEDDTKTAALHALLQMDEARATPILRKILARRDDASVCLRRRAVFMVAQRAGSEASAILLDAARNDPDAEVRGQAVFWLAQTGGSEVVPILDSVARTSDDPDVQARAVFGLAQVDDERATQALRAFVEREDTDPDVRANAIFWLGQRGEAGDSEFLRSHYRRTDDEAVRNQILFAISQDQSPENQRWLLDLAKSESEPVESRKQALFWAAMQGDVPTADLTELYREIDDVEMRKQIAFILAQRDDAEAVGALIDIARGTDDPDVRKTAVFWLSQSDDPRAADFLEELLSE